MKSCQNETSKKFQRRFLFYLLSNHSRQPVHVLVKKLYISVAGQLNKQVCRREIDTRHGDNKAPDATKGWN
jgi:hypothetical protein